MAYPDLPPHVVSGQPIASTWGNQVVDSITRLNHEGLVAMVQGTSSVPLVIPNAWTPLGIAVTFNSIATHRYSIHFYATLNANIQGSWLSTVVLGEGLVANDGHNGWSLGTGNTTWGHLAHGTFLMGPGCFRALPTKTGAQLYLSANAAIATQANATGAAGIDVTDLGEY